MPVDGLRFGCAWRTASCMSNVLALRLPKSLLAQLDRKATALGRTRAEHVRELIQADVAASKSKPKRFVACLALSGCYALGGGSDNISVRRALVASRMHVENR
jgi:hypothetical protein